MIGNEIEEEERCEEGITKMKKVAKRWRREIYEKAIVANTLVMSKVKFRANFRANPISEELKRSIDSGSR